MPHIKRGKGGKTHEDNFPPSPPPLISSGESKLHYITDIKLSILKTLDNNGLGTNKVKKIAQKHGYKDSKGARYHLEGMENLGGFYCSNCQKPLFEKRYLN